MTKEHLINIIENLINYETDKFSFIKSENSENDVDNYLDNVTVRLVNAFFLYKSGECGVSDYLAALRNFMLAYQVSLRIENSEILEGNSFGIHKDISNYRYYATYDVPDCIRFNSFVEKAFINSGSTGYNVESKFLLKTNGYIKRISGFTFFKSIEQKLCVYGALNTPLGYTSLISMPTGGGKSLVTQSIGFETKGLSIVVVPTVSLAIDQERAAKNTIQNADDNSIFCYYSGVSNFEEISEAVTKQTARLLFISPEALIKNEKFQQLIIQANNNRYIKNLIIDEAHIVVLWGDYFRVDYQCLGPWRSELLKANPDIRTFLLSATFRDDTVSVLKNIFSDADRWIEIRCDSLRKEPHFILTKAKGYYDKCNKVLDFVNKLPHPMILYVNAPYAAKKWKNLLNNHGYENIRMFTGETKSDERSILIDEWINNKYEIMIATSAFGVGVDKPDVRTVIHLYVPESPDTYYQELGRGGRDGLPCLSVMCIDDDDISSAFKHVSKVLTTEKLWGRWWSMYRNPSNQWQNGLIAILASTKPNYNKINYFEEGNNTDEKWNINVLLLLNRYEQIRIVSLDLDQDNRYIFTIKILNDQITSDSDETKQLFDDIREKESIKAQNAFGLIKNAIVKKDILCWSTMFYDTYPLVSEYCPGCTQHENRVADELYRFPLLVDVNGPERTISEEMKGFFSTTNEALIISKDDITKIVYKYLPDIVVCEDIDNIDNILNPRINYMNFTEFMTLHAHDNGFYISGLVLAIYSDNRDRAVKEYLTMRKYLNKSRYVIHVSSKDFYISTTSEKRISEQIDGMVIK